jgi:membrane-bound metal-dependent hydrolase YbcI (DUF457 family)
MFIFGHIGVTIGIFSVIGYLVPHIRDRINYWYVALGAILPDIIDKLLGRVILSYSLASGRLIAHTFVFVFLLGLMGFYIYKRSSDVRILLISGASFLHLLEDTMWMQPVNLFWPLFGWKFPRGTPDNWLDYFMVMFRNSYIPDLSYVFISDVVGFTIVFLFIVKRWKAAAIART